MYSIVTSKEVEEDLFILPKDVRDEVFDYFKKYTTDPFKYSLPLEDKGGRDLRNCRKTYVANATYRIIIQIDKGVAKIVSVIAVGERKDMSVYNSAYERLR